MTAAITNENGIITVQISSPKGWVKRTVSDKKQIPEVVQMLVEELKSKIQTEDRRVAELAELQSLADKALADLDA